MGWVGGVVADSRPGRAPPPPCWPRYGALCELDVGLCVCVCVCVGVGLSSKQARDARVGQGGEVGKRPLLPLENPTTHTTHTTHTDTDSESPPASPQPGRR